MNRNDNKRHDNKKGLVDPRTIRVFIVHHDCKLLEFLYEKLAPQSKKNIKHILANHQVSVGGAPVTQFDYQLVKEDEVIVSKNRIAKHERKDLPIMYEDENIIVINKPSGLLSIASDREKGRTAYRLVTDYVTQKNKKDRIFIVHRLDEDTSGVLVFAKNIKTKEALQKNWQDIVLKRGYYAIVEGNMEEKEAEYKDYLGESDTTHLVYVTKDKVHGKLSITKYKTIKEIKDYSLLDVNIDSGRKNQIRVQLGYRGHYIIGDDKYGEPSNPLKRLGLHAYELSIKNPLDGKVYDFKSEMPESFKSMFFGKKKIVEEKVEKPYKSRSFIKKERGFAKKNSSFKGKTYKRKKR